MVAKATLIYELLKSKSLNVTDIRRRVMMVLMQPGRALTQKELEEELEKQLGQVDRVTLYRTIRVLLGKGIIHQIPIDAQLVKYKLAGDHKKSDHPHFHCSCCNRLVCMPQLNIQQDMLPGGFTLQSVSLVIEGMCPQCNNIDNLNKTE